jgi:hypothetical protein
MGWGTLLRGLFGGKSKSPVQKRAAAKPPSGERAAILKEALATHKQARASASGKLDQAMKDLMANPPKTTDVAGMTRLLSLRRAILSMKGRRDS